MPIPPPLAFPPTALRNVAAGLVVGNPIGSGGTRAKALTAAELKAIVEASGISYLPLSGGTLTGNVYLPVISGSPNTTPGYFFGGGRGAGVTTEGNTSTVVLWANNSKVCGVLNNVTQGQFGVVSYGSIGFLPGTNFNANVDVALYRASAGILAQRNGLSAQSSLLQKSYTSDTNQEALMLDAGKQISGKLGLYSYRGSAGGSNYPIQIGQLAADGATFSGLTVDTAGAVTSLKFTASGGNVYFADTRISRRYDGVLMIQGSTDTCRLQFGGTTSAFPEIQRSGTGVKFRLADDSADANLTCGAIIASGAVTLPTITDAAAPVGSIYYSSTAGKMVFKDSGGTVRDLY